MVDMAQISKVVESPATMAMATMVDMGQISKVAERTEETRRVITATRQVTLPGTAPSLRDRKVRAKGKEGRPTTIAIIEPIMLVLNLHKAFSCLQAASSRMLHACCISAG